MTIIQPFCHSTSLYEKLIPSQGWHQGVQELLAVNRRDIVIEIRSGKCCQARATSYIPECSCRTPEAHRKPPDPRRSTGLTEEDHKGPDERKMSTLATLVHNSRGIICRTHSVSISLRTPGGRSVWVSRKSRAP